jgi:hypothetical protein
MGLVAKSSPWELVGCQIRKDCLYHSSLNTTASLRSDISMTTQLFEDLTEAGCGSRRADEISVSDTRLNRWLSRNTG